LAATALTLSVLTGQAVLGTSSAQAACTASSQSAQDALDGAGLTNTDCDTSGSKVNDVIVTVLNLLSAVVGAVAIVMVIIGGFRYITSGGEASKVAAGKNTVIYAIIGLVIVALAQFLVHFVINAAGDARDGKTTKDKAAIVRLYPR
jgi:hypothetical protein